MEIGHVRLVFADGIGVETAVRQRPVRQRNQDSIRFCRSEKAAESNGLRGLRGGNSKLSGPDDEAYFFPNFLFLLMINISF